MDGYWVEILVLEEVDEEMMGWRNLVAGASPFISLLTPHRIQEP